MKFKLAILFLLFNQSLIAKTILLSSFDPFDGAPVNKSEEVALSLVEHFKKTNIKIEYCPLRTVYFKQAETLKDCFHSLKTKPDAVISLGEGFCDGVYFNNRASNWMNSKTPDNDGVVYQRQVIRPRAPKKIYTTLNMKSLYKSLSKGSKRFVKVQKNTGNFVCNNLSYIMTSDLTESPYGFIHVPAHNCENIVSKTQRSVEVIAEVIEKI